MRGLLIKITKDYATSAYQSEEPADDAVCQRLCWDALQMAKHEMNRLQGELQVLEERITAKEQKLLELREAQASPAVITLLKEQCDRLVTEKKDLRQQLNTLQTQPGEIPAAATYDCCSDWPSVLLSNAAISVRAVLSQWSVVRTAHVVKQKAVQSGQKGGSYQ